MPSKLFHAVVGVGISLGSVTGCGGVADREAPLGAQPDAKAPLPGPAPDAGTEAGITPPLLDAAPGDDAAIGDGSPDVVTPALDAGVDDAALDAGVGDAAPDVAQDAIVGAFCDDPWPITKSGREVCGPYEDCAGTSTPWCFALDAQGDCVLQPLVCEGKQWHCLGGATPTNSSAPPASCS